MLLRGTLCSCSPSLFRGTPLTVPLSTLLYTRGHIKLPGEFYELLLLSRISLMRGSTVSSFVTKVVMTYRLAKLCYLHACLTSTDDI